MPRPFCRRRVGWRPGISSFLPVSSNRPHGTPDIITLNLDELEAIRLADLEGLYQEQAAEKMSVSRPTFARILESARKKVAEALVQGKGLVIGGGPVELEPEAEAEPASGLQPESEPGLKPGKFSRRPSSESTEDTTPAAPCPPFSRGASFGRGPYGCRRSRRGLRR